MAAVLVARYPDYWPETVRALLVHSGRWTEEMLRSVDGLTPHQKNNALLRRYGYGAPSLERASWSAADRLTLVAQESIKPFKLADGGRIATDEAHLHALPWPVDVLRSLHDTEVKLRVTLSYFVEPNPARRGFKNRHQYMSHGLRFRMIRPDESVEEFKARVSKQAQEEEEPIEFRQADWALGHQLRSRGSLHSDWWSGSAVDLAARGHLAVHPTRGWWAERKDAERWEERVRYSLVVAIETPGEDIYTPVEAMLSVPITT